MDRKFGIIIGVVLVGFVVFMGVMAGQKPQKADTAKDYSSYDLSTIQTMSADNTYDNYNLDQEIPADDNSGGLPENTKGAKDPKVTIIEYADYQCSACASRNPDVNKVLKDYGDQVKLIFRTYILPYHQKIGVQVSSAAEAAAIQGYWDAYKNLLFGNQSEWAALSGADLTAKLEEYFTTASDSQGDLNKFREDMASEAVAKKLAFDMGLGNKVGLEGTPTFYVNGDFTNPSDLKSKVEELLK